MMIFIYRYVKDENNDFSFVIGMALRYALGRNTDAPDTICNFIKQNLDLIKVNVLIEDIDTYYDKNNKIFKKININEIIKVESILYSNPRWGGKLINDFYIDKKD